MMVDAAAGTDGKKVGTLVGQLRPTPPSNDCVLELDSISKEYGSTQVVSDVSLRVREGEFITLLGASGSGKSTILMMVAGFIRPMSGDIRLRGRSIIELPPHKRRVGIVFQNYALFPHLTVYENVAFALRNARMKEDTVQNRVGELLAMVRLEDLEHRLPSQLSGGQQQRVAIARALAIKPDILLLDEPLGALDKTLREHMVLELQQLHRRLGTTMIYVTHDQEEALIMSDRIAIMDAGRLVSVGGPQQLYDEPATEFIAQFMGRSNILRTSSRGAVAVRPERIRIGVVPSGWTSMQAVITEATFLGDRIRYHLSLNDGGSLVAVIPREHGTDCHAKGATTIVGWHPDDARPLSVDVT